MDPEQRAPKASLRSAKSLRGVDIVDVAISALSDAKLTADQVKQLEALLKAVAPTEDTPSATQSQASGRFETIDGEQAVVSQIGVRGRKLDTLLSEGSFSKTRADQIHYAEKLGYKLATREEHLAYVNNLLRKEADGSINKAESNALETYRDRHVRDTKGGLDVYRQGVFVDDLNWNDSDRPFIGALLVRAS